MFRWSFYLNFLFPATYEIFQSLKSKMFSVVDLGGDGESRMTFIGLWLPWMTLKL